jgi:hypothetical protein
MRGRWLVLAAGVLLAAPRAFADEPKVDVGAAIHALASPDAAVRRKAAEDLGRTYPEGARGVAALREGLRDEDAAVREAVAASLRSLRDRGFVAGTELLRTIRLETSRSPDLAALAAIRIVGARPAILAYAANATDQNGRALAPLGAIAYAAPYTDPGARVVLEWLLDSTDPVQRGAAAAALAILGTEEATRAPSPEVRRAEEWLTGLVASEFPRASDPDRGATGNARDLRWYATAMLGHSPLASKPALDALAKEASTPRPEVFDEDSFDPAQHARAALALLVEIPAAHSVYRNVVLGAESPDDDALDLLVRLGDADAVAVLLASEDERTRTVAAHALVRAPKYADRAVGVLLREGVARDARGPVDPESLFHAWTSDVGYAEPPPARAAKALAAAWNRAKAHPGPFWADLKLAWALWRVTAERSPDHEMARSVLLEAISVDPARWNDSPNGPLGRIESVYRLLAQSRSSLPDLLSTVLDRIPGRPAVPSVVRFVESLASSGADLSAETPRIVAMIDAEIARLRALAARYALPAHADASARIAALLRFAERADRQDLADTIDPPLLLALVHVVEAGHLSGDAVLRALSSLDSVPGDALRVAVARARRVLPAPAAPPK